MQNVGCASCGLGDYVRSIRGNVCVWGHPGAQTVRLFIVGQNPGREENRENVSGIGRAWDLVRIVLDESNFPYAISNVVKCASKDDDEPTAEQLEACRPYLIHEILTYQPEVILALGNSALKALIGRSGVLNQRGLPQDLRADIKGALLKSGWKGDLPKVLCSVRPSYVLRIPNAKSLLEEDLQGAVRLCRQIAGEEITPDATWQDASFSDLKYTPGHERWTFDLESTGLAYRESNFHLHMIGVYNGEGKVKILTRPKDMYMFAQSFSVNGLSLTGFNSLAYDEPAMRWLYETPQYNSDDVMLLSYLVDETMPHHTLQACAVRWLGVTPWKDEVTWDWETGPQGEEEQACAKQYNARDVLYTHELWPLLWSKLSPAQQAVYRRLLVPAVRALVKIEQIGLYVSRANLDAAMIDAEAEIDRTMKIVQQYAEDNWLFEFNPNSPKQVRKLLFDKLGLNPHRVTKTGPSTDAETLKILAQDQRAFEVCHALLDHRGATKIKGSVLDRYNSLVENDGRLHPSYSVINTDTGRTSSWIQQIPRKPSVRRIIAAPPGHKLLVVDQSQIELRLMAWRSRDPEMLAVYRDGKYGGDLHNRTAAAILLMQQQQNGLPIVPFDKKLHKEERSLAKPVNFGCQYGQEAYGLQAYMFREYGVKVTFREAEYLRDEIFFGTFKGLPPYYNSVIEEVKKKKKIVSPFGRERHLLNIDAGDIEMRAEAARQAINSPNQADASDITLMGLFLALDAARWLKPVMFFHDANLFEVPDDLVDKAKAIVVEAMQYKVLDYCEQHFGVTIDVPLVAEAEVVQEWG